MHASVLAALILLAATDNAPLAVTPDVVAWQPGKALLAGAQVAVLEGDPKKTGVVTMRLKMPKGFRLPLHTHPVDERVTVLAGSVRLTFTDGTPPRLLPAGSYYMTPHG